MSNLKPIGVCAGIGGAIAGTIGYFVGGPAVVPSAIQAGMAGGTQVAVLSKADAALDVAAVKVEAAVDKGGEIATQLAEKIAVTVEKVADVWSKIFLIGYAVSIAFQGTQQSSDMFVKMCTDGILTNPLCIGSFTQASFFQALTLATGGALAREVYKITIGK